ncbi:hypothetical protein SEUCBS139899_000689 [Sporothrix eucalyptigena]
MPFLENVFRRWLIEANDLATVLTAEGHLLALTTSEKSVHTFESAPNAVRYALETVYSSQYEIRRVFKHFCNEVNAALNRSRNTETSVEEAQQRSVKNEKCRLLGVPPEILLEISDHLDDATTLSLSQTCRATRAIYSTYHVYPVLKHMFFESEGNRIRFLNSLARDRLDEWLCVSCMKMHPAMAQDTPSSVCNRRGDDPVLLINGGPRHVASREDAWLQNLPVTAMSEYIVKFRHVHLALKYAKHFSIKAKTQAWHHRQRAKQQQQQQQPIPAPRPTLADQLTSYHKHYLYRLVEEFIGLVTITSTIGLTYGVQVRVAPRIVRWHDGTLHFLMRTTYPKSSLAGPNDVQIRDYSGFFFRVYLCPHQDLHYDTDGRSFLHTVQESNPTLFSTENYFAPSYYHRINIITQRHLHWDHPDHDLQLNEMHTSCPRCPTDIVRQNGVWQVYQDLGNEYIAPSDPQWRVMHENPFTTDAEYTQRREAGSVQEIYDEDARRSR